MVCVHEQKETANESSQQDCRTATVITTVYLGPESATTRAPALGSAAGDDADASPLGGAGGAGGAALTPAPGGGGGAGGGTPDSGASVAGGAGGGADIVSLHNANTHGIPGVLNALTYVGGDLHVLYGGRDPQNNH